MRPGRGYAICRARALPQPGRISRMAERRSPAAIVVCLVALTLLTALDLGTKAWASSTLSQAVASPAPVCTPDAHGRYYQRLRTDSVVLVPNYLEFRYAENCGAAFSMFDRSP